MIYIYIIYIYDICIYWEGERNVHTSNITSQTTKMAINLHAFQREVNNFLVKTIKLSTL